MLRYIVAVIVICIAVFLLIKTAFYPFAALFAFDAPDAASHVLPWLALLILIPAPFLAAASVIKTIASLKNLSSENLSKAGALLIIPGAAFVILNHLWSSVFAVLF